jgi:hypothetical protein
MIILHPAACKARTRATSSSSEPLALTAAPTRSLPDLSIVAKGNACFFFKSVRVVRARRLPS